MMISVEVEYEDQTDHVLYITAEGEVLPAEPDVGVGRSVKDVRLYWTATGKELTGIAYEWVSAHPCLNDIIEDALLENAD